MNEFITLSDAERTALGKKLESELQVDVSFIGLADAPCRLPRFLLNDFDVKLIGVPASTYVAGLSEAKVARLRESGFSTDELSELTQSVTQEIPPFLLSETPINAELVEDVAPDAIDRLLSDEPALIAEEELSAVTEKFGCELPTWIELEFALRGNAETNFVFGDKIPSKSKLEKWLSMSPDSVSGNDFGFRILFSGEWGGVLVSRVNTFCKVALRTLAMANVKRMEIRVARIPKCLES